MWVMDEERGGVGDRDDEDKIYFKKR